MVCSRPSLLPVHLSLSLSLSTTLATASCWQRQLLVSSRSPGRFLPFAAPPPLLPPLASFCLPAWQPPASSPATCCVSRQSHQSHQRPIIPPPAATPHTNTRTPRRILRRHSDGRPRRSSHSAPWASLGLCRSHSRSAHCILAPSALYAVPSAARPLDTYSSSCLFCQRPTRPTAQVHTGGTAGTRPESSTSSSGRHCTVPCQFRDRTTPAQSGRVHTPAARGCDESFSFTFIRTHRRRLHRVSRSAGLFLSHLVTSRSSVLLR